jgi:flagellar biosynthetic protein FliR
MLIFVRIIAMLQIAPLFSSSSIPLTARIGFAMFVAGIVFPVVLINGYIIPDDTIHFFLLVIGEALIGIIIGFYLVIIFAGFLLAGQFFSLQMGFGASQVFDPLSQIEIPLVGQFLNLVAMLVFLIVSGFTKFILVGVEKSFESIRAIDLVKGKNAIFELFSSMLGRLFQDALTIAFPILGTLFLISVSMGLLAKAAPQMNLLMMGFPLAIGAAFLIMFFCMPFLLELFARIIELSFEGIRDLFLEMRGV